MTSTHIHKERESVCVCMCLHVRKHFCNIVILQDNLPLTQWYQNLASLLQVITQEKGLSHCNLQSHFHKTSLQVKAVGSERQTTTVLIQWASVKHDHKMQ